MDKRIITLHIRVSEDVADALKRLADADARKLSPFVALVLSRYVEEQGALEPKVKGTKAQRKG